MAMEKRYVYTNCYDAPTGISGAGFPCMSGSGAQQCCDSGNYCLQDGICYAPFNSLYYEVGCTDARFPSPCVKLCDNYHLTVCNESQWACTSAFNSCVSVIRYITGIPAPISLSIISTIPLYYSTDAASASASDLPSTSTTTSTSVLPSTVTRTPLLSSTTAPQPTTHTRSPLTTLSSTSSQLADIFSTTPLQSSTTTALTPASNKQPPPAHKDGIVLGLTVGGAVVIVGCCILYWCWRRRRDQKRNDRQAQPPPNPGEKDNYGMKVLYDSASAVIDIVFIHGLIGSAYTTWLHEESGVYWPRDLLKNDLKDARIITFGYDVDVVNFWKHAAQDGISGYANDLLGSLAGCREGISDSRRIIFVVHSLGGLVTQRALNISRESRFPHLRHIETYTIGICFLGTPHRGADLATWGAILTDIASVAKPANRKVVKLLERGSEMLAEIQDSFHNVLEKRKEERAKIEIVCFYELLPVIRSCVVPKESAIISGELNYPIHNNHRDMTKFSKQGDKGYQDILREIRRLARAFESERIV